MTTVLACGCFDLLHPGHYMHLKQARALGDKLVVALTLDDWVRKGAGRPVYPWEMRAMMLVSVRWVDEVVSSETSARSILKVRPHIYVKGIDYSVPGRLRAEDLDACRAVGAQIRFTTSPKMSATQIIQEVSRL